MQQGVREGLVKAFPAAVRVEALVGLGLGLPLAVGAAKAMLGAFSSELFALPFVLEPSTVTVTLVGVFVLVLLAQRP